MSSSPHRPVSAGSDKSRKSAGSDNSHKTANSTGSGNSALSSVTVKSFHSALSDDSYIGDLAQRNIDNALKEMLTEVKLLDGSNTLVMARKLLSHDVKKLDPADIQKRKWSEQMVKDHSAYKDKVKALEVARKVALASTKAAKKASRGNNVNFVKLEQLRHKALDDDEVWLNAAIGASSARMGFMNKYPDAFNTESAKKHVKAAQDNIDSVKNALRETGEQRKKITELKPLEAVKTAQAATAARTAVTAATGAASNAGASQPANKKK
ncbi:hypothetical protein C8A01DRAFT_40716 [Parachaetomium inaequale]|uniref:Uncharacterized protein n=1 Tax=Parachaetomium inaequale TaxID=2588326 RepID=A0AAN6SLJ5_9PEZI|nr:hypothetical protein C8A01DRAFT_40716 [Parachaetomium inaequale]